MAPRFGQDACRALVPSGYPDTKVSSRAGVFLAENFAYTKTPPCGPARVCGIVSPPRNVLGARRADGFLRGEKEAWE